MAGSREFDIVTAMIFFAGLMKQRLGEFMKIAGSVSEKNCDWGMLRCLVKSISSTFILENEACILLSLCILVILKSLHLDDYGVATN